MVRTVGIEPTWPGLQSGAMTTSAKFANCIEARFLYRVVSWCQPMQPDRHLTMPVKLHPQNLPRNGYRMEGFTQSVLPALSTIKGFTRTTLTKFGGPGGA